MLYDRPYMRQAPTEYGEEKASMVTNLIVITVGVFVLQQVANVFFPTIQGGASRFFTEWLALSGQNFKELKVWTLFSYGLLHSKATASFIFIPIPFAHLIFNMLALYLIGRHVEKMVGRQQFLLLYILAIFAGALTFLIFNFNGTSTVIGASAGVAAVVAYYCISRPDQQIIIFPLPIPIKARWILWGMIGITLLSIPSEVSGATQVSHSAHLGGLITGILYHRFIHNRAGSLFAAFGSKPAVEMPKWFKQKQRTEHKVSYKVNRSSREELHKEVNRILDKINNSGFGSLTESEKSTLDQAKDILNR